MKLSNVKFSEFSDLVKFLGKNNEMLILERISRFLPNLSSTQLFDMHFICSLVLNGDSAAESAYMKFIEENPDTMFDESGKSEAKFDTKNFWEIKLKSLDTIYETAEYNLKKNMFVDSSVHKADSQVYNGKNLANLINRSPVGGYSINKMLFFKKGEIGMITETNFKMAESILNDFSLDSATIMNKFLDIVSKKNYANYKIFAEHFLERLDCLSNDKELKNVSNREFLENLKKIK